MFLQRRHDNTFCDKVIHFNPYLHIKVPLLLTYIKNIIFCMSGFLEFKILIVKCGITLLNVCSFA